MSQFARRHDWRRLSKQASAVFDLLNVSKTELGLSGISLGLMSVKGGRLQVDLRPHNETELCLTTQEPGQKQQIRLQCAAKQSQSAVAARVAKKLQKAGFPVRVRGVAVMLDVSKVNLDRQPHCY